MKPRVVTTCNIIILLSLSLCDTRVIALIHGKPHARAQVQLAARESRNLPDDLEEPEKTAIHQRSSWHPTKLVHAFQRRPTSRPTLIQSPPSSSTVQPQDTRRRRGTPTSTYPYTSKRYASTVWVDKPTHMQALVVPVSAPVPRKSTSNVHSKTPRRRFLRSNQTPRQTLMARVSRQHLQNIMYQLLDRWSQQQHSNMQVQCNPSSSILDLARGYVRAEASVEFQQLQFPKIRMSQGRIEAHGINLNLWSFSAIKGIPRFPDNFTFWAKNVTFAQDDLFQSDCIRHGLERLVRQCLQSNIRTAKVTVDALHVPPQKDKVACQGRVETLFGTHIPFELRTGLSTSARGHTLQFPGLEIALGPLGIFVPVLPEVALDLGYNAQILDVKIDGATSSIILDARCTISPRPAQLHSYSQSPKAFAANFHFDVGKWVTKIGRFSSSS